MNVCAIRVGKSLFAATALLLLTQLASVSARAQEESRILSVSVCGTTINAPGRYTVTNDLNCAGDGITIGSTGVELNLAGHRITGTSSSAAGINASLLDRGDVQIVGPGTIQGFGIGVNIAEDFDAVVHVTGVTTSGAHSFGFNVRLSKAILRGNTATGSPTGFHLLLSDNGELSGNMANGNSAVGFAIGGSHNQVMHNTALNNGIYGIEALGAQNQITNNTAMGNHKFDLVDENGTCANQWASNTFGTKNPACIR
jgi:parallel beta-helix repeat protein